MDSPSSILSEPLDNVSTMILHRRDPMIPHISFGLLAQSLSTVGTHQKLFPHHSWQQVAFAKGLRFVHGYEFF